MKVKVKWIDGVSFVGESETGHAVVLDGAPENGGRNIGMRPMEMLLIGMGGCTSFDVVAILKKARQPIVGCVAEIDATRADASYTAGEAYSESPPSVIAFQAGVIGYPSRCLEGTPTLGASARGWYQRERGWTILHGQYDAMRLT